jgi:cation transport ATPase
MSAVVPLRVWAGVYGSITLGLGGHPTWQSPILIAGAGMALSSLLVIVDSSPLRGQ